MPRAIHILFSPNFNYSVNSLVCEHNENLLTMRQNGLTMESSSAPIDKLRYTYFSNTNRLKKVIDAANAAVALQEDFHYLATAKAVATEIHT